jgi:hypothetical protein
MMSIFIKFYTLGIEILSVWELADWWLAISNNIRAMKFLVK